MAVFKCKMCGGTIEFNQGDTVGICDSCGTKQSLPIGLDDEKRANLYDRANHFRRNNEYDKAMSIYEQILNEDSKDAEAYWSIILCRYGIEYVEDPKTHTRVPTVNRVQFSSVVSDKDYKSALKYGTVEQKEIYKAEARKIDKIQKGILEISSKEEPFDIFICYKETDNSGRRTPDSVLANDLYHQLTQEGYKVFFSRITLEDKLGQEYEPYIFAALNSAKVMVVLGTKPEYFNAVWVRNEWSRYLALIKNGEKKMLIPAYKDMDPYDLPEEFSHLQAQDMSKLGFMQDLIRGINKIITKDEPKETIKETVVVNTNNSNVVPLLERVTIFLEDGKWNDANIYCEKVLDIDPKNAQAYLGKLMAELKVKSRKQLADCAQPFDNLDNYGKVIRFGDEKLENDIREYISHIKERNENNRLTDAYTNALNAMNFAKTEADFNAAARAFQSIADFKDSKEKAKECLEKAEAARKDAILADGKSKMTGEDAQVYKNAISIFKTIPDWKNSTELILQCEQKIEAIKAQEEADRLEAERRAEERRIENEKAKQQYFKIAKIGGPILAVIIVFIIILNSVIIPSVKYNSAVKMMNNGEYEEAIKAFEELDGYKESEAQIKECNYLYASALLDAKRYDEAYAILNELGKTDSINESMYNRAMEYIKADDKISAYLLLSKIVGYKDAGDKAEEYKQIFKEYGLSFGKAENMVTFGTYEQDNDTSNGKEDIEWLVLAKEENKLLLISDKALDCQLYNESNDDVTWETCSLRNWLNNTFLNEAFSPKEQKRIQSTNVSADKNPVWDTDPGKATTDKVFLLSINEVKKYFASDEERMCAPTAYAIENGVNTNDDYTKNGAATCWWWLRTPGDDQDCAAYVYLDGGVREAGCVVNLYGNCVRPAIWIDLDA